LPPNTISEVYRVFDKCVRIYREIAKDRISIKAAPGFAPRARVNDKTFPIIATALIENAIKHSVPDDRIAVELAMDGSHHCLVSVSNTARGNVPLTPAIFGRGVRGETEAEGSGNGLYLANLVAKQHSATLDVQCAPTSPGRQRVTLKLRVPLILSKY
jgi:signal transduction histidine kinase